jgi:DNA-binding NarL/FixJ family response regulator
VAIWLARCATNRGIAGQLGISERTVESHVANILIKLELKTHEQAMFWVLKHFPEEAGVNW